MAENNKEEEKKYKSKYLEHKNIDDFLEELKKEHSEELKKSFKIHDEYTADENMNHLYNDIFTPALDDFYTKAKEELAEIGSDETKTEGKEKEIKGALAKALLEYFEKSHPTIKEKMEELEIEDEEEMFDYLAKHFDRTIGADPGKGEGIYTLPANYARSMDATIGHLKKHLKSNQDEYATNAINGLVSQHYQHHFHKYHPTEIAAYFKPLLEDRKIKIKDKVKFGTLNEGELRALRMFLKTGKLPKEISLEQLGLEMEKPEGKKPEEKEE